MMDFYRLILGCLVVWRVSHLLNAEDAPWDLITKMRRGIGHGIVGKLFDCFYCLSLWIALPLAWVLGSDVVHQLLLWPALSAGAILIERLTRRQGAVQALPVEAPYFEAPNFEVPNDEDSYREGDNDHELLRTRDDDAGRSV